MTDLNELARAVTAAKANLAHAEEAEQDAKRASQAAYEAHVDAVGDLQEATRNAISGAPALKSPETEAAIEAVVEAISDDGRHDEAAKRVSGFWGSGITNGADKSEEEAI